MNSGTVCVAGTSKLTPTTFRIASTLPPLVPLVLPARTTVNLLCSRLPQAAP